MTPKVARRINAAIEQEERDVPIDDLPRWRPRSGAPPGERVPVMGA